MRLIGTRPVKSRRYDAVGPFFPDIKSYRGRTYPREYFALIGVLSVAPMKKRQTNTPSDGFLNNERLFLPLTAFNRFAVTREINDGLLAPRFAPSQRAWLLSGFRVAVTPAVPASQSQFFRPRARGTPLRPRELPTR